METIHYRDPLHQVDEAAALRKCGTPAAFGGVLCGVTGHLVGRVTVECAHR